MRCSKPVNLPSWQTLARIAGSVLLWLLFQTYVMYVTVTLQTCRDLKRPVPNTIHRFYDILLHWRKVPESEAWSVGFDSVCCFTSTETVRTIRDGEPRTATSTFTQLLRPDLFAFSVALRPQRPQRLFN